MEKKKPYLKRLYAKAKKSFTQEPLSETELAKLETQAKLKKREAKARVSIARSKQKISRSGGSGVLGKIERFGAEAGNFLGAGTPARRTAPRRRARSTKQKVVYVQTPAKRSRAKRRRNDFDFF